MVSLAASVDAALKAAAIPIVGVSIGSVADKATWKVQFLPEATGAQQTQAASIIAAFDPNDPALVDTAAAQQFDGDKLFKAKALSDLAWRLGKAPGALTPAEITAERSRIIAIYKAL